MKENQLEKNLKNKEEQKTLFSPFSGCIFLSVMIALVIMKSYDPTNGLSLFEGYLIYTSVFLFFTGIVFYNSSKEEKEYTVETRKPVRVLKMIPNSILAQSSHDEAPEKEPHESKEEKRERKTKTAKNQLSLELTH